MKHIIAIALFGILAGCTGKPVSMGSTVPVGYDAFACVLRELARYDYGILDIDRESGFVRASLQTSGGGSRFWFGSTEWDLVTVTVFEDVGAKALRVVASKRQRSDGGYVYGAGFYAGSDDEGKPSEAGLAFAEYLLISCRPMR